jgi:hypothetical protein
MNKHILFVIDHLANHDKYTQAELLANYYAADAYYATDYSYSAASVARATAAAVASDYADAAHWVDEYFKCTGEDKQTYIDALGE